MVPFILELCKLGKFLLCFWHSAIRRAAIIYCQLCGQKLYKTHLDPCNSPYYPHFVDENTEAQRGRDLPKLHGSHALNHHVSLPQGGKLFPQSTGC